MRRSRGILGVSLLVLHLVAVDGVAAQSADQQVMTLNRQAMDAYNNLDINRATTILEDALSIAQQYGISGQLLAGTYLNLGVVFVGGLGDRQQGLDQFLRACCIEPTIQLDPLLSTPDIQSVYQQAQQMSQSGGCAAVGLAPAAPAPVAPVQPQPLPPAQPQPVPPAQPMAPTAPGVPPPPPPPQIIHQPPVPQVSQAPLPLYAEVSGVGIRQVQLYYRGLGMDNYKRVEMVPYSGGAAFQVSCRDVWEPRVRYYITAIGKDGRIVASAGTAQAPFEAQVVTQLQGEGPSLPGATSPGVCREIECPPGVTGEECEKPPYHGMGEECEEDKDCQPGLMCEDDQCWIPGAGREGARFGDSIGGEEDDEDYDDYDDGPARTDFAPGFIQLGFTLGLSQVAAGMITDGPPPGGDRAVYVMDESDPNYLTFRTDTPWIPDADSWERNPEGQPGTPDEFRPASDPRSPIGDECTADDQASGSDAQFPNYLPTRYCARVDAAGFVMMPAMRVAIGYFVIPRLSVAAVLRYQFEAGDGTLSSILLGGRAEYLILGGDAAKGFMLSAFAGMTAGQIQPKPPPQSDGQTAPFVISGIGGAHVGVGLRYRFHRNFGIVLTPELDLQFPNFLLNVDTTIGAEAAF